MYMIWHKTIAVRAALLVALAAADTGIFLGARSLFPPPGVELQQWLGSSALTAAAGGHRQARPLDMRDAATYRLVFASQRRGDFAAASLAMNGIGNDLLTAPVLFQRYTDPRYAVTFAELKAWLDAYADQPGASRIYHMALDRVPAGQSYMLALPTVSDWSNSEMRSLSDQAPAYQPAKPRPAAVDLAVSNLRKAVHAAVRRGDTAGALALMNAKGKLKPDSVEYDQMRSEIAHGLFNAGHYRAALDLATACLKRSGADAPEAAWVAGLIAWRAGHHAAAAEKFELVTQSRYASGWGVSAGAYWAARAARRAGDPVQARRMLEQAAAWPRTFYGQIAIRALGRAVAFNWKAPVYTKAHATLLAAQPAFRRAEALRMAGETGMAERQLLALNPGGNALMREAMIAYAQHAGLPALSMRLASIYTRTNGDFYDAALYPVPPWRAGKGKEDTTLLLAVIRQESGFDPGAVSARGAVGLMQVMPDTAAAMTQAELTLTDPVTNLAAGQRYLASLQGADRTGGQLIPMLVAYNAGPGNLTRWQQQYADSMADPLLFIESLPFAETRNYVQHVVTNDWIYRQRLDLPAPLLVDAAADRWTLKPPVNIAKPVLSISPATRRGISLTIATAR